MSLKNNTVAVVDYGMGNLRSVSQAVRTAAADTGWEVVVTADPEAVQAANRVVLPGQGHGTQGGAGSAAVRKQTSARQQFGVGHGFLSNGRCRPV